MRGSQVRRWFLGTVVVITAVSSAVGGPAFERDHIWANDPRSLAASTRGLEEFLPKAHSPLPESGFGSLLGEWTWGEIGISSGYQGAGISIDYPYLYLCNPLNDSIYIVDVSSGVPESLVVGFAAPSAYMLWGIGMDDDPELWVGKIQVPDYSSVHGMSVYPPTPTVTGDSFRTNQGFAWMADMSDNFPGDTIFQLRVGGANPIYAFHEPSGVVGRSLGDTIWAYVSQRGLTYNQDCGTFFVGGWNSNRIWEISYADGSPIPGRDFYCSGVSGLAYQDSACDGVAKLWVQTNSHDNPLALYYIGSCDETLAVEEDLVTEHEPSCLLQNSPNPFYRSTMIPYSIPTATHVTLTIHDVAGRLIETLMDESQQPGMHQVNWSSKINSSGIYFYTLRIRGFKETKKMVMLE